MERTTNTRDSSLLQASTDHCKQMGRRSNSGNTPAGPRSHESRKVFAPSSIPSVIWDGDNGLARGLLRPSSSPGKRAFYLAQVVFIEQHKQPGRWADVNRIPRPFSKPWLRSTDFVIVVGRLTRRFDFVLPLFALSLRYEMIAVGIRASLVSFRRPGASGRAGQLLLSRGRASLSGADSYRLTDVRLSAGVGARVLLLLSDPLEGRPGPSRAEGLEECVTL